MTTCIKMKSYVKKNQSKIYTNVTKLNEKEKWHRALDHVNFQYLNISIKNKLLDGFPGKIASTYEAFHVNCPSARRASPKSCYF